MTGYPAVNWWRGNVRPYESGVSLISRFCKLNGINLNKFHDFIGFRVDGIHEISGGQVEHLAKILGEPIESVQEAFLPVVTLSNCGKYSIEEHRETGNFNYCEVCASHGYHSHLHEARWLERCPFDGSALKHVPLAYASQAAIFRRMAELVKVMDRFCPAWPWTYGKESWPDIDRLTEVKRLIEWVDRVGAVARQTSDQEVWSSDVEGSYKKRSLRYFLSRLCSLEAPPQDVAPLLTSPIDTWHIQGRRFPESLCGKLDADDSSLNFDVLLRFYKSIIVYSEPPPIFFQQCRAALKWIRERHGVCGCKWRSTKGGWESHWIKIPAGEYPYYSDLCPFDVVLRELELGWGRAVLALPEHQRDPYWKWMCHFSKELLDMGLIRYASKASLSPNGQLASHQLIWPACEWIDGSPLTDLLEAMAEFELESTFNALLAWLNGIDEGLEPSMREETSASVHIARDAQGLELRCWTREKAR